MKLLDTPQWDGLSEAQKRIIGNVYGNGGEWTTGISRGGRALIEGLVAKGLVTADWGERQVTIRLRAEGWA